jgi:hypothetical protein
MSSKHLYRVFLQDGGSPNDFVISSLEMAVDDSFPGNKLPSLTEQVRNSKGNTHISMRLEDIDSHWIIEYEGRPVRVAENYEQVPAKCYDFAVQEARRRAKMFSDNLGGEYVFIDLTSRANIPVQRIKSGIISREK